MQVIWTSRWFRVDVVCLVMAPILFSVRLDTIQDDSHCRQRRPICIEFVHTIDSHAMPSRLEPNQGYRRREREIDKTDMLT
jgi:hypothetical protein